jgi:hypothetical protein
MQWHATYQCTAEPLVSPRSLFQALEVNHASHAAQATASAVPPSFETIEDFQAYQQRVIAAHGTPRAGVQGAISAREYDALNPAVQGLSVTCISTC